MNGLAIKTIMVTLALVFGWQISKAQDADEPAHKGGAAWGGTGKVCNVCHEPFELRNTNGQAQYRNHQVSATTFSGKKQLDGAPVLIKSNMSGDECQRCHTPSQRPALPKKYSPAESEADALWR